MAASQGRYELFRTKKIFVEGNFSKKVINTYMKCKNIPRLRMMFFLKIAYNRDYEYNLCNRPYKDFHRHCREWYFYDNTD